MASTRNLLLPLVLLAAAAATRRKEASITSVTPVEQVIQLLEDMKTKVEDEGRTEAGTYDTFACFCRDTTQTKSTSITTGNDNIDRLSADIQADTATKATKATELADRRRQQEDLATELSDTQARCLSEMAGFEASIADLSKAVRSLTKAIDAMRNSMPSSLLSIRQSVSDSLALADAMGLVVKSRRPAIEAFLQARVDPSNPGYQYHSNEIITTLENLKTDFTTRQTDTQTEWDKARNACDTLKTDLGNQMSTNSGTMTTLSQDMDSLATTIASNRESLVNAENLLQDDQLYLKDLTQQCEARAKDWDQRSQMRADEITALTSALAILKDGADGRRSVSDLDAVNQRALLLQRPRTAGAAPAALPAAQASAVAGTAEAEVPSLLQEVAVQSEVHGRGLRGGQRTAAVSAHSALRSREESSQRRALALLRSEGKRLGSGMLTALASQAAVDPFAKVKNLIQKLIERLLSEATQEATKKGFCDEEIGKATKARDFRLTDTKKLAAEIGQLNAKKDELDAEIGQLNTSLAGLRSTLNQTQVLRDTEHTENLNTTETAREGLAAVKQAITILKVFYSQAARATVLVQASPVNATPGFQGAYTGNQDGSVGVIRILEVVKSDFERTIRTTEASEAAAVAAFVEFDRTSKADISGKEMTMQLNQEDFEKTGNRITQKMTDLDSAQQLLDSALRTIEDLKPMCIDTTMSFAERKAKREEEIAALKTAMCYLDPNQVESECQTR
mmetsp:Transcript_123091/g.359384  ORF Transcript_123091/g.359384 Transcript_123091/m.359384 type:complete len:737 (+) Transcript_123091:79-2289(+)